ncbi:unnamed protein product [Acanthoscelides obtectus]|uniref:Uncharacterized protein n=1 Tax=Acanthoscelides obtectus TaxID=200917 RepID=A0A9P0PBL3_ACAOB|nr:unnamed protein product [Acanthoscelides obtectus]CAK1680355.1 hypothetical protein AOBTE_LOCUS32593 [Acanthoscelides obtectus]
MISPRTEAKWQQWYEEIESDVGSELDIDDAASEHSLHDTNTEQSSDSDDEDICLPLSLSALKKIPHSTGKDGTPWLKHKPPSVRTKTCVQNIVIKLPGVIGEAKTAKEIMDCWKIFFPWI